MSATVEWFKDLVKPRDRDEYEALGSGEGEGEERLDDEVGREGRTYMKFNWVDYGIFVLLGTSMLWAWNMYMAAGPYFQRRFSSNQNILGTFQSSELAVSTVANLGALLVLSRLQSRANYPRRVNTALCIYIIVFTLLAISTRVFLDSSAAAYFAFVILTVLVTSMATGIFQNGIFSYMSGLGRAEYLQGNMVGQAIAGVLPCIVQIISVLAVPVESDEDDVPQESSTSAFAYFLTATGVSAVTLFAFFLLLARHGSRQGQNSPMAVVDPQESIPELHYRETISYAVLFRKLSWLCTSLFLVFSISMFFPVYTQQIYSVKDASAPRIFQPSAFIPLALFFWNLGDLLGRIVAAVPRANITSRPRLILALSIARVVFIPLYTLCNIGGRGAKIDSDTFYLLVQLLFGLTNGFLGSQCMMGFVDYVEVPEREAAGAFMSTTVVLGLAAGSFASFLVPTKG